MTVSCAHPSFVPTCPKWSTSAVNEFIRYRLYNGDTVMVQAILRDAQVCNALKILQ